MHCIGRCTFIPLSSIIIISFHSGYSITAAATCGLTLARTCAKPQPDSCTDNDHRGTYIISQWAACDTETTVQHSRNMEHVAAPTQANGIRERDFKSAEADEDIDLIRQWAASGPQEEVYSLPPH